MAIIPDTLPPGDWHTLGPSTTLTCDDRRAISCSNGRKASVRYQIGTVNTTNIFFCSYHAALRGFTVVSPTYKPVVVIDWLDALVAAHAMKNRLETL